MERCHEKPFAVNKAVTAAWRVNRRPGKPCENHLIAALTKWVRSKRCRLSREPGRFLSRHTGQTRTSPLPAGTGVMPGCVQLLGRRPTVCKELGEQPSQATAVKTLVLRSGRPTRLSLSGEGCRPGPGLTTFLQMARTRLYFCT